MKKPTNIINTPPADNESWGSYNSETKQWSEKVYSGKAIREWIQSSIQSLKELLAGKVDKESYNEDKVALAQVINGKADKVSVGTSVEITYPRNFVVETSENASDARDALKNVKYEVKNADGTKLFEFWAMAQEFVEKQTVTYPNVWFIPSNTALTASNINSQIQSTDPKNNASSYTNTFDTTNYYVVVESSHNLTKVANAQGFDYTNQFNTTDVTISGYKVYHYSRVIGASVTWIFTIN